MRCDYAAPLSHERCRGDGRAAYHVTVRYDAVASDHLHLCAGCTQWLKKDARGHGYKVTLVKVAPPVTAEVRR